MKGGIWGLALLGLWVGGASGFCNQCKVKKIPAGWADTGTRSCDSVSEQAPTSGTAPTEQNTCIWEKKCDDATKKVHTCDKVKFDWAREYCCGSTPGEVPVLCYKDGDSSKTDFTSVGEPGCEAKAPCESGKSNVASGAKWAAEVKRGCTAKITPEPCKDKKKKIPAAILDYTIAGTVGGKTMKLDEWQCMGTATEDPEQLCQPITCSKAALTKKDFLKKNKAGTGPVKLQCENDKDNTATDFPVGTRCWFTCADGYFAEHVECSDSIDRSKAAAWTAGTATTANICTKLPTTYDPKVSCTKTPAPVVGTQNKEKCKGTMGANACYKACKASDLSGVVSGFGQCTIGTPFVGKFEGGEPKANLTSDTQIKIASIIEHGQQCNIQCSSTGLTRHVSSGPYCHDGSWKWVDRSGRWIGKTICSTFENPFKTVTGPSGGRFSSNSLCQRSALENRTKTWADTLKVKLNYPSCAERYEDGNVVSLECTDPKLDLSEPYEWRCTGSTWELGIYGKANPINDTAVANLCGGTVVECPEITLAELVKLGVIASEDDAELKVGDCKDPKGNCKFNSGFVTCKDSKGLMVPVWNKLTDTKDEAKTNKNWWLEKGGVKCSSKSGNKWYNDVEGIASPKVKAATTAPAFRCVDKCKGNSGWGGSAGTCPSPGVFNCDGFCDAPLGAGKTPGIAQAASECTSNACGNDGAACAPVKLETLTVRYQTITVMLKSDPLLSSQAWIGIYNKAGIDSKNPYAWMDAAFVPTPVQNQDSADGVTYKADFDLDTASFMGKAVGKFNEDDVFVRLFPDANVPDTFDTATSLVLASTSACAAKCDKPKAAEKRRSAEIMGANQNNVMFLPDACLSTKCTCSAYGNARCDRECANPLCNWDAFKCTCEGQPDPKKLDAKLNIDPASKVDCKWKDIGLGYIEKPSADPKDWKYQGGVTCPMKCKKDFYGVDKNGVAGTTTDLTCNHDGAVKMDWNGACYPPCPEKIPGDNFESVAAIPLADRLPGKTSDAYKCKTGFKFEGTFMCQPGLPKSQWVSTATKQAGTKWCVQEIRCKKTDLKVPKATVDSSCADEVRPGAFCKVTCDEQGTTHKEVCGADGKWAVTTKCGTPCLIAGVAANVLVPPGQAAGSPIKGAKAPASCDKQKLGYDCDVTCPDDTFLGPFAATMWNGDACGAKLKCAATATTDLAYVASGLSCWKQCTCPDGGTTYSCAGAAGKTYKHGEAILGKCAAADADDTAYTVGYCYNSYMVNYKPDGSTEGIFTARNPKCDTQPTPTPDPCVTTDKECSGFDSFMDTVEISLRAFNPSCNNTVLKPEGTKVPLTCIESGQQKTAWAECKCVGGSSGSLKWVMQGYCGCKEQQIIVGGKHVGDTVPIGGDGKFSKPGDFGMAKCNSSWSPQFTSLPAAANSIPKWDWGNRCHGCSVLAPCKKGEVAGFVETVKCQEDCVGNPALKNTKGKWTCSATDLSAGQCDWFCTDVHRVTSVGDPCLGPRCKNTPQCATPNVVATAYPKKISIGYKTSRALTSNAYVEITAGDTRKRHIPMASAEQSWSMVLEGAAASTSEWTWAANFKPHNDVNVVLYEDLGGNKLGEAKSCANFDKSTCPAEPAAPADSDFPEECSKMGCTCTMFGDGVCDPQCLMCGDAKGFKNKLTLSTEKMDCGCQAPPDVPMDITDKNFQGKAIGDTYDVTCMDGYKFENLESPGNPMMCVAGNLAARLTTDGGRWQRGRCSPDECHAAPTQNLAYFQGNNDKNNKQSVTTPNSPASEDCAKSRANGTTCIMNCANSDTSASGKITLNCKNGVWQKDGLPWQADPKKRTDECVINTAAPAPKAPVASTGCKQPTFTAGSLNPVDKITKMQGFWDWRRSTDKGKTWTFLGINGSATWPAGGPTTFPESTLMQIKCKDISEGWDQITDTMECLAGQWKWSSTSGARPDPTDRPIFYCMRGCLLDTAAEYLKWGTSKAIWANTATGRDCYTKNVSNAQFWQNKDPLDAKWKMELTIKSSTECAVECEPGFFRSGASKLTCKDGQWSPNEANGAYRPFCHKPCDTTPTSPLSAELKKSKLPYAATTTVGLLKDTLVKCAGSMTTDFCSGTGAIKCINPKCPGMFSGDPDAAQCGCKEGNPASCVNFFSDDRALAFVTAEGIFPKAENKSTALMSWPKDATLPYCFSGCSLATLKAQSMISECEGSSSPTRADHGEACKAKCAAGYKLRQFMPKRGLKDALGMPICYDGRWQGPRVICDKEDAAPQGCSYNAIQQIKNEIGLMGVDCKETYKPKDVLELVCKNGLKPNKITCMEDGQWVWEAGKAPQCDVGVKCPAMIPYVSNWQVTSEREFQHIGEVPEGELHTTYPVKCESGMVLNQFLDISNGHNAAKTTGTPLIFNAFCEEFTVNNKKVGKWIIKGSVKGQSGQKQCIHTCSASNCFGEHQAIIDKYRGGANDLAYFSHFSPLCDHVCGATLGKNDCGGPSCDYDAGKCTRFNVEWFKATPGSLTVHYVVDRPMTANAFIAVYESGKAANDFIVAQPLPGHLTEGKVNINIDKLENELKLDVRIFSDYQIQVSPVAKKVDALYTGKKWKKEASTVEIIDGSSKAVAADCDKQVDDLKKQTADAENAKNTWMIIAIIFIAIFVIALCAGIALCMKAKK